MVGSVWDSATWDGNQGLPEKQKLSYLQWPLEFKCSPSDAQRSILPASRQHWQEWQSVEERLTRVRGRGGEQRGNHVLVVVEGVRNFGGSQRPIQFGGLFHQSDYAGTGLPDLC